MSHEDIRGEVALLAASLRAHAEWQRATGALGLPRMADRPDLREGRTAAPGEPVAGEPVAAAPGVAAAATPGSSEPARPASTPSAGVTRETAETLASGRRTAPAELQPGAAASDGASARAASQEQASPGGLSATGAVPSHGARSPTARTPEPHAAGPSEDGRRRLAVLESDVRGCTACGLHATRTQTVFARGSGSSGLCFIGEGPGADEDAQGSPFVGKAGQLLDRMITAMGLSRDDVYVCNIVKCRPPKNRKPEPEETAACRPFLEEQLTLVRPKVIVALGATAVTGLLGISGGITRLRGEWRLYRGEIPVMPTFHPAYLLRQPSAKREVWDDLKAVLEQMGMPAPPR